MRERLRFFISSFVYWILFFALARLIFIFYNYSKTGDIPFSDLLLSFVHGARMDASVAGYFMVIPSLVLIFTAFFKGRFYEIFSIFYTILVLLIAVLIVVIDAELYRNWGFRIDATPLFYLKNPKEAAASSDVQTTIILIVLLLILYTGSFVVWRKLIAKQINSFSRTHKAYSLVLFLLSCTLFIPVRGSFGVAPINTGMVYFSEKYVFANHAAINPVWNFVFAVSEQNDIKPIDYYDTQSAEEKFRELYPICSKTEKVLKTNRPNIVIIILESFTAKATNCLGGMSGITPNLERIGREGILFTQFYASGERTDKGIPAILSGYPAQPTTSILKFSDRTEKLPTLTSVLKKNGYKTQWVCGFNTDFANMKSYILHNQFDQIIDINDFPSSGQNSKWGIHDGIVFERLAAECMKSEQPFFKVYMSLSSHEPFDVPGETRVKGETDEQKFLNSMVYTDEVLGKFYDALKKSPSWENTLIIITADHGSRHPGASESYEQKKFHIPAIWAGGALAVSPKEVSRVASQTDIANSLLSQLDIFVSDFRFGKDIFSPDTKSFAFYNFNNGFGFVTDSTLQIFDNSSKSYITNTKKSTDRVEYGNAYEQILMRDFIDKKKK